MMYANTLWQPYASLVAIRVKPFETRGYPPPRKLLGQRIAIHAAKCPPPLDLPGDVVAAIELALQRHRLPQAWDLPRGAVVCTAELTGAYRTGETWTSLRHGEMVTIAEKLPGSRSIDSNIPTDPYGNYAPGRWLWRLEDVEAFAQPIPAKGKQGWWFWEPGR